MKTKRFHPLFVFLPSLMWSSFTPARELLISRFDSGEAVSNWTTGVQAKDGVKGGSIKVREPLTAVFKKGFPFHIDQGSVEFWLKTDWAGNDGHLHRIISFGRQSEIAIVKDKDDQILFVWMPQKGRPMKIGTAVGANWPSDIWRHLAFTWERTGAFRIFLDGRNVESGKPVEPPAAVGDPMPLTLGGSGSATGMMQVDELRVHDSAISAEAVRASFLRGIESREKMTGDARLTVFASVDGTPGCFMVNTGSNLNAVFRSFATKAGMELFEHQRDGRVYMEASSMFNIHGRQERLRFIVPDGAPEFQESGMMGWIQFLAANRLLLDWDMRTVRTLPANITPEEQEGWRSYPIDLAKDRLVLEAQTLRVGHFEATRPLIIETGTSWGISIPSDDWKRLREAQPGLKTSSVKSWTPHEGIKTHPWVFPEQVKLLDKMMSKVSISESRQDDENLKGIRVGLSALSFFEVIIDGPKGQLWLMKRDKPALTEPGLIEKQ